MITVTRTSILSGNPHRMDIPMSPEDYERAYQMWQAGVLIQNAFPTLTAEQREFIKTGIIPIEWNALKEDLQDGGF